MFLAEDQGARAHSWDVRGRTLTVALSARWDAYPQRFDWIANNGFAVAYTPGLDALHLLKDHTRAFVEAGIPVRYHGFFPGHEFGHANPDVARAALRVHESLLHAMQGHAEQVVTFHVGLRSQDPIDSGRAVEGLSRLTTLARSLGITVCLENLRRGPTSHPDTLLAWARESDAAVTLDVGHAVSCEHVRQGHITVIDFVDRLADRLEEVHMYGKETDRHHPIESEHEIAPVIGRLLDTRCTWWTVELNDCVEAAETRQILYRCVRRLE